MIKELNILINLIDTDEKRLNIVNDDKKSLLFLLGYNYSKIDRWVEINLPKDKVLKLNEIIKYLDDEDLYKIYTYFIEIKNEYENIVERYSL